MMIAIISIKGKDEYGSIGRGDYGCVIRDNVRTASRVCRSSWIELTAHGISAVGTAENNKKKKNWENKD